jgi:membrane protein YdbS with pleckstrin-like domain
MNEDEFRAQIEQLPPGMRWVVSHVVTLSVGVIILFGALLVAALVVHSKASGIIVVFCVVALVMAVANLTLFRFARRRVTPDGHDPAN